jgi:HNH endonuclease
VLETETMMVHVGEVAIDWREADRQLRRIAARRAALDLDEARWLLVARRERVHEAFGFASLLEYVERVLGHRPHAARERLRVAEALVALPAMREALGSGELGYSAVRELTRIAEPATEAAWRDAARGKTVREIETLVSGHAPGDLPPSPEHPPDPDLEPRVLRLALGPDVYAMFLEARRVLEADTGESLDDSAVMAALCERACRGGEPAAKRPPYQIALTVCERCGAATQDAAGQVIAVPPSVVARAACDAEHVGRLDAADADVPAPVTADIPDRIRRQVRRRDHGRCVVPGCRHRAYLEIHHLVPRAAGGDHDLGNLVLLCDAHHRAHHDGRLRIDGRAPDQLRFTHADGRPYGSDALADARRALRDLGFPAPVADAAVAEAASHAGQDVPLPDFLRACLRACPRPSG